MKPGSIYTKQYISESFHVAKVIAILSVILAHTIMEFPYPVMSLIKQRFSSIGVMVFLFISAYYFHPEKYSSVGSFFRRKLITVIVPWIFLSSLMYVWTKIDGLSIPPLDAWEWLLFLIGYKTYLYYIPILLACYLLFSYLKRSTTFLVACVGITVVSLLCTAFGLLDTVIEQAHLTHYLNPFNWIGYFALGILAAQYSWVEACMSFFHEKRWRISAALAAYFVLVFVISAYLETDRAGYFAKSGMVMQLFGLVLILMLSFLAVLHRRWLIDISDYTYTMYLIHMIFIRLVVFASDAVPAVKYIAPLITFFTTYATLMLVRKVTVMLHIHCVTDTLFGLRK